MGRLSVKLCNAVPVIVNRGTTYYVVMDQPTLVLVQIVFRHGDRSPNSHVLIYPGDPHENVSYMPFGKGQLTQHGRKRSYEFGKQLLQRYSKYLGPEYYEGISEAHSSEVQRTRTTLQLVLASLFPPTETTKLDDNLNWQPVPFNYTPLNDDSLIGKICVQIHNSSENHPEFSRSENSLEVIRCIKTKLNWDLTRSFQCMLVYDKIKTQIECGLEMPEWAVSIFPEKLKEERDAHLGHNFKRDGFIRDGSGGLIKKINDDMWRKVTLLIDGGKNRKEMSKIFLYSVHDLNLLALLYILKKYSPGEWPHYLANLMFELYQINDEFYVKILYDNGNVDSFGDSNRKTELKVLQLNCDRDMCTLSEFTKYVEGYFPQVS